MASSNLAYIYVAASNGDTFTNAFDNDMLLYPAANNQRILIGNQIQGTSTLTVGSNLGVNYSNPQQALSVGGNIVLSNFGQTTLYSSNNYVGIGVSNPSATLTVGGGATISGDLTINNAVGIKGLTIYKRSAINANISSTSVQGLSNDTTGLILKTASNNHAMYFYTSNTERARITSDGILQLATNTPIIGSNIQSYSPIDYGTLNMSIPGTISGTVPATSSNPFNIATEGAISFNGTLGNYITLSNSQYVFNWWTTSFTVEAWVNYSSFTNASTSGQPSLIGNMQPTSAGNYWSFGPLTTGVLTFFYWTGAYVTVSTTATIPTNTWTHIAASCDGTNIRLFINGTLSQTAAISMTPQVGYNGLTIGQFYNLPISALVNNMRLVKGAALYTASFTPATSPLSPATTGSTLLLLRVPQNTGRVLVPKIGGGTQVREYPPVALTSAATLIQNASYGLGTYYATASSVIGNLSYTAYASFDKSTASYWQAPASLYRQTTPYDYIGTVNTIDTAGNVYLGEWLQLQLPCSILLSSFTLISLSGHAWSYPNTFQLLGSLDGANWACINRTTGNAALSSTYTVNASQAYSYYRLIIFSQNGVNANNSPTVCELIIYGSQESIVSTTEGQVGLGVSRPVQALEVAGNGMFYGNISANNMGMFRNKIINGDMSIDQRNNGAAATSASTYFLDRWSVYQSITTGVISIQRVGLTSSDIGPFEKGFKYSIKCTATTALSNYGYWLLQQLIEGFTISDLNWAGNGIGCPVTLSFWFRAAQTGYYNIVMRNFYTSIQSWIQTFTVTSANTWAYYTVTVPPPTGSGTQWNANNNICQMQLQIGCVVKSNQSTAGWSAVGSAPESVTGFTDWVTTVNNYIQLTGVQLEKGNVATPFEFRPYPIEMQLCQRYFSIYFSTNSANYDPIGIGYSEGTNAVLVVRFPVDMRTNPALYSTNIPNNIFLTYFGNSASSTASNLTMTSTGTTISNNGSGFNTKTAYIIIPAPSTMPYGIPVNVRAANTLVPVSIGFNSEL